MSIYTNIYIIVTIEDIENGNMGIHYHKQLFFFKDAAFEAAKKWGDKAVVMQFQVTDSWNHRQRGEK